MSSDCSHDLSFGNIKKDCILLFPTKELNFQFQKGIYVAKLALSNINTQPILYKIKITATKFYNVYPTAGKLLPGEKILVNIKMPYPEEPETRIDDRFLVQAFITNDPYIIDDVNEVMEAFKTLSPNVKHIQQAKLKVHYEIPGQIYGSGQKSKSPSTKTSLKQVTWKNELEEKEEGLNGVRTASTNNSLKNEDEIRSPANSIHNLNNNNNQDNSMQIFTPQKQSEHKRNNSDLNHSSSGSMTFRRLNLRSGTKKKSIEEDIKASMTRGIQRTDMTEALLPAKAMSTETRKNVLILDENNNISIPNVSQAGISDVSSTTAARRNLMLKQKFLQLENKYKIQKAELEGVLNEKEEYINELNKLRHIFGNFLLESPEAVENNSCKKLKGGKRFEIWQLMFVSVICLILGSILRS